MKRTIMVGIIFISMIVILTGCLPGDGTNSEGNPAGFFWGIWHGWLAPISLIIGFFKQHIQIYEKFNTGWWYDFGFYIAIISGFGGISLSRNKARKKDK